MLIENPNGNFRFIKGRNPFSSGAIAEAGYEIVRAIFDPLPLLDEGFTRIESHLRNVGRPLNALCGMELRIPKALSYEGFVEFNKPYVQRLAAWRLHVGDLNPVARTNVAAEVEPVPDASLFGFSYTIPSNRKSTTFVISGVPEIKIGSAGERSVVALGDVSRDGMRQKIRRVLESLSALLLELGASWADATAIGIYTVHDFHPYLRDILLREVRSANMYGIHWHFARPPVADAEFEMDVRRTFQEVILSD
jgi:hypothetical protein